MTLATGPTAPPRGGGFLRSAGIGLALTTAMYAALPHVPDPSGMAARYLTGHPLEYAIAALAVIALVDLASRSAAIAKRSAGLRRTEDALRGGADWRAAAEASTDPAAARRLAAMADLRDRGAAGVVDHADRLSARAGDDLAGSYAPLTTICWAIPIVGFLGTVMGITIAVANISPEQLEGSLGSVTGGLAVAFDTTALALALSLVLGFGTLFVRRAEERLLGRLDDLCDELLVPSCERAGGASNGSAELIESHVAAWAAALERQRGEFGQSLEAGHRHFVAAWADQQAQAIEGQRLTWDVTSDQMGESLADWQAKLEATLDQIAGGLPQVAAASAAKAAETADAVLAEIGERTTAAHRQMEAVARLLNDRAAQSEALLARCEQLAGDVVTQMAEQNRRWADVAEKTAAIETLQASADTQFDRAKMASQMDQTLHQLTAAVHMLTARSQAA